MPANQGLSTRNQKIDATMPGCEPRLCARHSLPAAARGRRGWRRAAAAAAATSRAVSWGRPARRRALPAGLAADAARPQVALDAAAAAALAAAGPAGAVGSRAAATLLLILVAALAAAGAPGGREARVWGSVEAGRGAQVCRCSGLGR